MAAWVKWVKFTTHLHGRKSLGSKAPLDGAQVALGRAPYLHASPVIGQRCRRNKTYQKSATSISGCVDLTSSIHIDQTIKKPPPYLKMNYSSCFTWPDRWTVLTNGGSHNLYPHHKIFQTTERQTAITLPSVYPELMYEIAMNRATLYLPITYWYGIYLLVQLVMSFTLTFSSSS